MYKKTITYVGYDGVERTEDFYFHITKSEIFKLELSIDGGYAEMLQRMIDKKDAKTIMKYFDEFIKAAYGEKSDDGRRFVKSKEISEAFSHTPAYDKLFMECVTDTEAGIKFITEIFPPDIQKTLETSDLMKKSGLKLTE